MRPTYAIGGHVGSCTLKSCRFAPTLNISGLCARHGHGEKYYKPHSLRRVEKKSQCKPGFPFCRPSRDRLYIKACVVEPFISFIHFVQPVAPERFQFCLLRARKNLEMHDFKRFLRHRSDYSMRPGCRTPLPNGNWRSQPRLPIGCLRARRTLSSATRLTTVTANSPLESADSVSATSRNRCPCTMGRTRLRRGHPEFSVGRAIVDEVGPPIAEGRAQKGDTKVFEYQSVWPHRAFVELRLAAEELEAPAPGLNARDRGSLIHSTLERFWREVRSQESLIARTDIPQASRDPVVWAIERFEQRRGAALSERFAQLERRRLAQLATDWLEVEKLREPFEVVEPEGEREAEVGGIRFRLKLDRIDRLQDGSDVIVDYKTSPRTTKVWDGDRLRTLHLRLELQFAQQRSISRLHSRRRRPESEFTVHGHLYLRAGLHQRVSILLGVSTLAPQDLRRTFARYDGPFTTGADSTLARAFGNHDAAALAQCIGAAPPPDIRNDRGVHPQNTFDLAHPLQIKLK